jgi:hypothetical protein
MSKEVVTCPPPGAAFTATAPDLSSWLELTQQAATLIDPKVGNVNNVMEDETFLSP